MNRLKRQLQQGARNRVEELEQDLKDSQDLLRDSQDLHTQKDARIALQAERAAERISTRDREISKLKVGQRKLKGLVTRTESA